MPRFFFVLCQTREVIGATKEGSIHIWSIDTGKEKQCLSFRNFEAFTSLTNIAGVQPQMKEYLFSLSRLCVTPTYIIAGDTNGHIFIWSRATAKPICVLSAPRAPTYTRQLAQVLPLSTETTGEKSRHIKDVHFNNFVLVAAAGESIFVWNASCMQQDPSIEEEESSSEPLSGGSFGSDDMSRVKASSAACELVHTLFHPRLSTVRLVEPRSSQRLVTVGQSQVRLVHACLSENFFL